jgi:hypothetical protein
MVSQQRKRVIRTAKSKHTRKFKGYLGRRTKRNKVKNEWKKVLNTKKAAEDGLTLIGGRR